MWALGQLGRFFYRQRLAKLVASLLTGFCALLGVRIVASLLFFGQVDIIGIMTIVAVFFILGLFQLYSFVFNALE